MNVSRRSFFGISLGALTVAAAPALAKTPTTTTVTGRISRPTLAYYDLRRDGTFQRRELDLRIEGMRGVPGRRVLLTSQRDPRHNGPWVMMATSDKTVWQGAPRRFRRFS